MKTVPDAYRARYFEGQRLRATDLAAEQAYLIELERRHNTTLHSSGVVLGLDRRLGLLGKIERQPGVAIDDHGDILILDRRRNLTEAPAGKCIDSWLVRCEAPRRLRHPGLSPCSPGAFDRWCDFVQVVDIEVDDQAELVAPVEGAVYLGRTEDKSVRASPFTSLTAAQVIGPSGDFIMLVGAETGHSRDGFSVRVVGESNSRLALDRLGVNRLNGTVTLSPYRASVRAELSLAAWPQPPGGAPQPQRGCLRAPTSDDPVREPNGLSFEAMPATPKAPPLPGVYSVQTGDAVQPAQQFRFDLGEKRENDPSPRFSIGSRETRDKPYKEWFYVTGVGTIHLGPVPDPKDVKEQDMKELPVRLKVTGSIRRGPIKVDPADPIFTQLLMVARQAGLQASKPPPPPIL